MKALASPVRLQIVDELRRGERCMCELQPMFAMNKSTLSRHIAELRNVGIIGERRDGVRIWLWLKTPCILGVFDCAMNVIRADAEQKQRMITAEDKEKHGRQQSERVENSGGAGRLVRGVVLSAD